VQGRGLHRGQAIDLDVRGADLHDVFRLIADAGRVNLVSPTMSPARSRCGWSASPGTAAACAVAGQHHLVITVDGNILLVMRAAPGRL